LRVKNTKARLLVPTIGASDLANQFFLRLAARCLVGHLFLRSIS
jgi:hypothetical protein